MLKCTGDSFETGSHRTVTSRESENSNVTAYCGAEFAAGYLCSYRKGSLDFRARLCSIPITCGDLTGKMFRKSFIPEKADT